MPVKDWMPPKAQKNQLHDRFIKLNPEIDPQVIDFESHITDQSYNENLMDLANAYPQYTWFEDETDVNKVREEAKEDLQGYIDYMVGSVPEEMQEDLRELLEERLGKWMAGTRRLVTANKVKKELRKEILSLNTQIDMYKEKLGRALKEAPKPKGTRVIQWDLKEGRDLEEELLLTYESILVNAKVSKSGKMAPFKLELAALKKDPTVSPEEARERIRQTADNVAQMWSPIAKKFKPLPPPEPKRGPALPPIGEPEGEDVGIPTEFGAENLPDVFETKARYQMPYPRRPSGSEIAQFDNNYNIFLLYSGLSASPWRIKNFKIFENATYTSWDAVKEAFEALLKSIENDRELIIPFHLVETGQILTAERMAPENHAEMEATPDSVKKFIREAFKEAAPAGVYGTTACIEIERLVSIRKNEDPRPTLAELAYELTTFIGPTNEETIRSCLETAIRENKEDNENNRPLRHPNLIIVPLDYLEELLG